jgi:hypothetical protein
VGKSIARLALWCILIFVSAQIVFVLQQTHLHLSFQTGVAFALMSLSLLAILGLAQIKDPQRASWIGVHAGIITLGIAAVFWAPAWSGYLVGIPFAFAIAPNVLYLLGERCRVRGYNRSAAICVRLAYLCHPSRYNQFISSFWAADALVSVEARLAAYRALAIRATAEQFAILNCSIAVAQDDWEGVLGQIRSAGETATSLKWLEIRALGEIGQVEEMRKTYVLAESILRPGDRIFCWLFVMAFRGYVDEVRSVLRRELWFLRSRNKAYWIFVADQAAGAHDQEARRVLASFAHAADDETFRKAAQRHLTKASVPAERIADPSIDYRGFVISWLEPPLASDKWTANIATENASFLRRMSRGPTVITGRTRVEMFARARSWIDRLIRVSARFKEVRD